jgi:hypothetical protein
MARYADLPDAQNFHERYLLTRRSFGFVEAA